MSKPLISIKEILENYKSKLLEEKSYQQSHKNYLNELNQIYGDKIIDLKDVTDNKNINKNLKVVEKRNLQINDNKIIYLNNEVTNELIFDNKEKIINLTEEFIDLSEEIIDLSEEIIEEDYSSKSPSIHENYKEASDSNSTVKPIQESKSEETIFNQFKLDQLENSLKKKKKLNNKTQDHEKQNDLLFNKLDDLTNQNLDLSDKIDKDLDHKIGLALSKIEEQSILKIRLFDEKITNIQDQTERLKDDIDNSKNQMSETISDISNTKNELLETINSKIENVNEISSNDINNLKFDLDRIELKFLKNIEEKQKNSNNILNEFQEKLNEMNNVLEIQNNQNTLKKDFSPKNNTILLAENNDSPIINNDIANKLIKTISELKDYNDKNFHDIKTKISNFETQNSFEKMNGKVNELKDYNDQNFHEIKTKISNFEKKNLFETLQSIDLEKKFESSDKKFDNLYDAKEYVTASLANQTDNWIESNKQKIDEISKKLLED